MLTGFICGFWLCGSFLTFTAMFFLYCLAGFEKDLWKPFTFALIWPVALYLIVKGKI